jgi:hypothetical protein
MNPYRATPVTRGLVSSEEPQRDAEALHVFKPRSPLIRRKGMLGTSSYTDPHGYIKAFELKVFISLGMAA